MRACTGFPCAGGKGCPRRPQSVQFILRVEFRQHLIWFDMVTHTGGTPCDACRVAPVTKRSGKSKIENRSYETGRSRPPAQRRLSLGTPPCSMTRAAELNTPLSGRSVARTILPTPGKNRRIVNAHKFVDQRSLAFAQLDRDAPRPPKRRVLVRKRLGSEPRSSGSNRFHRAPQEVISYQFRPMRLAPQA